MTPRKQPHESTRYFSMTPQNASSPAGYQMVVPTAHRALAAMGYLSGALLEPLVLPVVIWLLFPQSRFLRGHAFLAAWVHGLGILIAAALKLPGRLLLIELELIFVTPEEFAGTLFKHDPTGTAILLGLLTVAFMVLVVLPAVARGDRLAHSSALTGTGARPRTSKGDLLMRKALLATVLTPLIFYMEGIWGAGSGDSSFFGLHLDRFEDPYALIPGHVILLWSMTGALIAGSGERVFFGRSRAGYAVWLRDARLARDARMGGGLTSLDSRERLWHAARWRALVLPGWGQAYLGGRQAIAGAGLFACFMLIAFFWWLSFALLYGDLVLDTPGLNANLAWQFLSGLGLRSNVLSDAELMRTLGRPLPFALMTLALLACYAVSHYATRIAAAPAGPAQRAGVSVPAHATSGRERFSFVSALGAGVLLHAVPIALIFVIPITLLPLVPPGGGLPDTVELSEDPDRPLNEEHLSSGEDAETSGRRASRELPQSRAKLEEPEVEVIPLPLPDGVRPPEPEAEELAQDDDADLRDAEERESDFVSLRAGDEDSALGGKRRKQSYSSYLSVRIRAPEKELDYWDQMPQPYAAVFEYRISASGEVSGVRVVEASGHPAADELTVRIIRSMRQVLPPPGGKSVVVTELFWNTSPDDPDLKSVLQRKLSQEFDGRVIERR